MELLIGSCVYEFGDQGSTDSREIIKAISWHTAFKSMRLHLKVACMIGLSGAQSKLWNRTVPISHALWWCATICETLLVTPRQLARTAYMVRRVKEPARNAGDMRDRGWIPGWGRSPGGGKGNPLQYSCLKNPMDRETWRAMVLRAAKSFIWLSAWTCTHTYMNFENIRDYKSIHSEKIGCPLFSLI